MLTKAVAKAVLVAIYQPAFFFIAIKGIAMMSKTEET